MTLHVFYVLRVYPCFIGLRPFRASHGGQKTAVRFAHINVENITCTLNGRKVIT